MISVKGMKGYLNQDLTRYNSKLVDGLKGKILYSDGDFYMIEFSDITYKILHKSFVITDSIYHEAYNNWLKSATNIVYKIGSKGGFNYIVFDYIKNGKLTFHHELDRKDAMEMLEKFKSFNLLVTTLQDDEEANKDFKLRLHRN